jgi:hypothetical protein
MINGSKQSFQRVKRDQQGVFAAHERNGTTSAKGQIRELQKADKKGSEELYKPCKN